MPFRLGYSNNYQSGDHASYPSRKDHMPLNGTTRVLIPQVKQGSLFVVSTINYPPDFPISESGSHFSEKSLPVTSFVIDRLVADGGLSTFLKGQILIEKQRFQHGLTQEQCSEASRLFAWLNGILAELQRMDAWGSVTPSPRNYRE